METLESGYFGSKKDFDNFFARPLRRSRSVKASREAIAKGQKRGEHFRSILNRNYLRRTKDKELADQLPKKVDRIVFCPPSRAQAEVYQRVLG